MNDFKIGVIADSFKAGIAEGIRKAAKLGVQAIQVYAVEGEMAPENLSTARRREILDMIESNGMVVSAICGDLGGYGFAVKKDNPSKIDRSKRIMELAKEMKSDIVTTHVGVVPSDINHPRRRVLEDACGKLGEFAQNMGSCFAIETGPEKAAVLGEFLNSLGNKGIGVNFDPANLVMVTGDDPAKAVKVLGDHIVHTHAKDGIMLRQTDPEVIYDYFAEGGIEDINLKEYFIETPLGQGSVDFIKYLDALRESGFKGFLTIEREVGDSPEADISLAVGFLRSILQKL